METSIILTKLRMKLGTLTKKRIEIYFSEINSHEESETSNGTPCTKITGSFGTIKVAESFDFIRKAKAQWTKQCNELEEIEKTKVLFHSN